MDFQHQLQAYKAAIDSDITAYAQHVLGTTRTQYGEHSAAVTSAYFDMLQRGGKRIRGALAMVGYEMCGGTDRQMIVRAATALEMMHAYILIIDDIQDRSKVRRGKPTVHEMLATYHTQHKLKGDAAHTGVSLALNAALAGNHAAQMLFAGLSVSDELRTKVLGIVNLSMLTTSHGQTYDILNERLAHVSLQNVEDTLEWKTAHYTVLNPLCVGMVLAGVGCEDTDAIRGYALPVGIAFQITDDIIGVFGTDKETGKSSMDDIREGKRTLLTLYALEHAAAPDQEFLRAALGNESLTRTEFEKVRGIIRDSGALEYAQSTAAAHTKRALNALHSHPPHWNNTSVAFLRGLAEAVLSRTS